MNRADIVIVGGGLAGAVTAESYRKSGGGGSVTILTADENLPVHRPPLSKEYLRGDERRENVFVHPPEFYEDNRIDVRLGARVEAVEAVSRRLRLADGSVFDYGTLVLATGASPRRLSLPGGDLPGVFYLRSLESSEALQRAATEGKRVVVIGAGFIGMEVAATLTRRGLTCTVVEVAPRMWMRLVPPAVSDFIERYFGRMGVSFRFGSGVSAMRGEERVQSVVLDSGEDLQADVVVAGVGVALNTELAASAGLPIENGILVDEYLRTSVPSIHAVGDVANFPDPVGGRLHLEHWDNALQQGRALGGTLAGNPTPFEHVAYFFSDMFDLSLNMIGYPLEWDETVVRGDAGSGSFTTIYIKDGRVRAALMLNDDALFGDWESLVKMQAPANVQLLGDPSVDAKTLLAATAVR